MNNCGMNVVRHGGFCLERIVFGRWGARRKVHGDGIQNLATTKGLPKEVRSRSTTKPAMISSWLKLTIRQSTSPGST
jgi:hypothetical protein